jgi:hypothetical protein
MIEKGAKAPTRLPPDCDTPPVRRQGRLCPQGTDSARTLGAAGGVDLEAVLHLAHLHARGDPGPWFGDASRQRAGERWSEVALDGEPLGMRSS